MSIKRVFSCPGKQPEAILFSITFAVRKTKKTDESPAASLQSSTRAKTTVERKAVSVGYTVNAGIRFDVQEFLGVQR